MKFRSVMTTHAYYRQNPTLKTANPTGIERVQAVIKCQEKTIASPPRYTNATLRFGRPTLKFPIPRALDAC